MSRCEARPETYTISSDNALMKKKEGYFNDDTLIAIYLLISQQTVSFLCSIL